MKYHLPPPEQLSELVGLVYACAIDPGKMPDLLRLLNRYVHGACAQICTVQLGTGAVCNSYVSDGSPRAQETNRQYLSHWSTKDPRAKLLASLPSGTVFRCQDHFNEAFVWGSDFYQDFLIPQGFRWTLAGMFHDGEGTATVVSAVRATASAPFEDWTLEALRHLLPHFERAHKIESRLDRQAAVIRSTTEMLALLATPCLFTDEAGRCIEANDAFRQSAERLALHLVTGRVRFNHPDQQAQWQAALWETCATGLGRTVRTTGLDGRHWSARLTPWDAMIEPDEVQDRKMILAVFEEVGQHVQPSADLGLLKARLTRAELEVLAVLLKGKPARAIAGERGISVNTVRTQIVAILEKTGFKSQKELLASFGASSYGESGFDASSVFHHTNE